MVIGTRLRRCCESGSTSACLAVAPMHSSKHDGRHCSHRLDPTSTGLGDQTISLLPAVHAGLTVTPSSIMCCFLNWVAFWLCVQKQVWRDTSMRVCRTRWCFLEVLGITWTPSMPVREMPPSGLPSVRLEWLTPSQTCR